MTTSEPTTRQEQTPLDPAAVMAEHVGYRPRPYSVPEDLRCEVCHRAGGSRAFWPCLPYRLAAELVAMREREADAWDEGWKAGAHDQKRWSRWGEESDNYVGATPNPYRAALAGDAQ